MNGKATSVAGRLFQFTLSELAKMYSGALLVGRGLQRMRSKLCAGELLEFGVKESMQWLSFSRVSPFLRLYVVVKSLRTTVDNEIRDHPDQCHNEC